MTLLSRQFLILNLAILLLLGATSSAWADFLFTHQGDTNPLLEGFTGHVVFGASSTFGPLPNDLGKPAWQVTGLGQSSQYGYFSGAFNSSQIADVANQGFTLTMVARAIQNIAPIYDDTHPVAIAGSGLNIGSQRFDIDLGLNSNGDTVVFLFTTDDAVGPGQSLVATGPSYTLSGNDYHTYSLIYSPVSQLADLYVDGVLRIQGYAGNSSFHSNVGMFFGAASGGQANINFVQISSVPEPSTLALAGGAATCLAGLAYRRQRRDRLDSQLSASDVKGRACGA